jgi:hypothetical protein
MFHEIASALAGFVLIMAVLFVVGDALGLLGKPFAKITWAINWMDDLPDMLISHVLHRPTRHRKAHV